jgi:DNA-directed RNA polymerase subunit RPC12/RpoP
MICGHPPPLAEEIPRDNARRCRLCGHRVWEINRSKVPGTVGISVPKLTRRQPSRWFTEHYRRAVARGQVRPGTADLIGGCLWDLWLLGWTIATGVLIGHQFTGTWWP